MIENINNSDILSYNPNLDINTRPDIETYPEYFCKICMKKYKKMIENNMEKK